MLKKILVWGIVLMVLATAINDVGRYFGTWSSLDSFGKDAAENVSTLAGQPDGRDKAGRLAMELATAEGYRLYGFDVQGSTVTLWLEADVTGTWVAGPFSAYRNGERDFSKLWEIPLVVRVKSRGLV